MKSQTIISTYILMTLCYIIWRAVYSLNPDQPMFSALFLMTDIITGVSSIGFVVSLWKSNQIMPVRDSISNYSVDIWIPTLNEDIEVLRKTIYHAVNILSDHNTYVLDDGNREEVKLLAEAFGARYISRQNNKHAKAGNLNNALDKTESDLIAVFDADFIADKSFINKLIGYFNDKRVAIVQTPQYYYSTHNFQNRKLTNGGTYSEQDTFLHTILPSRTRWNAAYWIGTNGLLRREAIISIGGFPVESITEDILTSILIHSKGWSSIYVDEPLALGKAPSNVSQYFTQRSRWAKGAFQIFRKRNPLFVKGLTVIQKVLYFSSLFHFIDGAFRMVYYLLPALFFIFGIVPIKASSNVIIIMVLYFLFSRILLKSILKNRINFLYDEIYSIIRSFIYLSGFPALLTDWKIKFKVTPKTNNSPVSVISFFGPVLIFTLNFVVVISSILNPSIILEKSSFVLVSYIWVVYIFFCSLVAYKYCYS